MTTNYHSSAITSIEFPLDFNKDNPLNVRRHDLERISDLLTNRKWGKTPECECREKYDKWVKSLWHNKEYKGDTMEDFDFCHSVIHCEVRDEDDRRIIFVINTCLKMADMIAIGISHENLLYKELSCLFNGGGMSTGDDNRYEGESWQLGEHRLSLVLGYLFMRGFSYYNETIYS